MSALRAALEAAFPDARILDDGTELYATVDLPHESVSLLVSEGGVIAVRHLATYAGMAEGRTAEEALAGLLGNADRQAA